MAVFTPNEQYWQRVRDRAAALGSDGCTAVSEWNRDCCLLHDVMCRTGMDMDGRAVTRGGTTKNPCKLLIIGFDFRPRTSEGST